MKTTLLVSTLSTLLAAAACGSIVIDETGSASGGAGGASALCGNALIDPGEVCDSGPCCGLDCVEIIPGCVYPPTPVCGNNKIEPGEQCDGGQCCSKDCKSVPGCLAPCGNGKVDAGEECDDGKANSCTDKTTATCTCTCKKAKCGDGIRQAGEQCDHGDKNGVDDVCDFGCVNDCGCASQKIFAKVVSSQGNPVLPSSGLPSVWSYKGLIGLAAGKALCQDVGADHVCRYDEVVAANAKGELAGIPTNLTYWLHRTTNVPDPKQPNKACSQSADCAIAGDAASVCDPVTKICSWKPGLGGRCNDWTYPSDHTADGEWFRTLPDPTASGAVKKGTLSFHFLQDTSYDAMTPPVCKDESILGCAGSCSGVNRAILCCHPACQC